MFRLKKNGELQYYVIDEFENTGLVKHCFTTRCGGVSKNEYESMNLRLNCDDSRENILTNYRIICDEIGVNYKDLVLSNQVHEDKICTVGRSDCGNGIVKPQKFESADALITNEEHVPIAVFGADCVPIYFLDTAKRAIGLAHSGWKGTAARIGAKTALKMVKDFHSKPEHILAAIGPSIRLCHFEVGDEVAEIFREIFGDDALEKHKKYHVNMQKAISIQLQEIGIPKENIIDSGLCTYCKDELFFSHRRTGGRRGVMAAIMELKDRK
ncbi:MAG: peptidoglycan editing factor PgeF [Clostridiales bacterium]|nr:peptidoglycan editing factor PgeF [Clostridiales bacterium]